jgi:hypothetical protein
VTAQSNNSATNAHFAGAQTTVTSGDFLIRIAFAHYASRQARRSIGTASRPKDAFARRSVPGNRHIAPMVSREVLKPILYFCRIVNVSENMCHIKYSRQTE